jgi:hypothetical protein
MADNGRGPPLWREIWTAIDDLKSDLRALRYARDEMEDEMKLLFDERLSSASPDAHGDIAGLIRSPRVAGWKNWGIYSDWGKVGKARAHTIYPLSAP